MAITLDRLNEIVPSGGSQGGGAIDESRLNTIISTDYSKKQPAPQPTPVATPTAQPTKPQAFTPQIPANLNLNAIPSDALQKSGVKLDLTQANTQPINFSELQKEYLMRPLNMVKEFAVEKAKQFQAGGAVVSTGITTGLEKMGLKLPEEMKAQDRQVLKDYGLLDEQGNMKWGKIALNFTQNTLDVAPFIGKPFAYMLDGLGQTIVGSRAIPLFNRSVKLSKPVADALFLGTYSTAFTKDLENIFKDKQVQKDAIVNFLGGSTLGFVLGLGTEFFKSPLVVNSKQAQQVETTYKDLARKYHPDITGGATTQEFTNINNVYAKFKKGELSFEDTLKAFKKLEDVKVPQKIAGQIPEVAGQTPKVEPIAPKAQPTNAQLEAQSGWLKVGDKEKFDTAILLKDKETVKSMLPIVPKDYQDRFAKEITALVGESPKAVVNQEVAKQVTKNVEPIVVYRGTTTVGEKLNVAKENGLTGGESTSTSRDIAQRFADKKGGEVQQITIKPDASIINHSYLEQISKGIEPAKRAEFVKNFLKENSIDVVKFDIPAGAKGEEELRIINPDAVDISTVPVKEVKVPRGELPVGTGKVKASKLEARMKGVIGNATQEQIDKLGLSTFEQMNKKESIARASEIVANDPEKAIKMLTGDIPLPKDLPRNALYVALQESAKGNTELALRVTSLRNTRYGQELSLLTELDKNNPVSKMEEIIKVREEVFEKRTGKKASSEVKKQAKEIKKEIPEVSKSDWSKFIDSIEC